MVPFLREGPEDGYCNTQNEGREWSPSRGRGGKMVTVKHKRKGGNGPISRGRGGKMVTVTHKRKGGTGRESCNSQWEGLGEGPVIPSGRDWERVL